LISDVGAAASATVQIQRIALLVIPDVAHTIFGRHPRMKCFQPSWSIGRLSGCEIRLGSSSERWFGQAYAWRFGCSWPIAGLIILIITLIIMLRHKLLNVVILTFVHAFVLATLVVIKSLENPSQKLDNILS
jgi:hypothetical protein